MSEYTENVELVAQWKAGVDEWLLERGVPAGEGIVSHPSNGAVVMEVDAESFAVTKAILEATSPIAALWDPNGDHEERIVTLYSRAGGWMSIDCVIVPTEEERAEGNS